MALQWGVLAGVAGSIMSQVLSQINNKKQQQQADAESARRVAALEAKANENPLANSETRQFLGQYDRAAQRQIENARGVGNIKGASNEYMLGVQKAVAEGRADLMGNIEAKASERSDKYNDMAEVARHEKAVADQERTAARQQSYANLAANSMAAAGSLIDAYGGGAAKAPRNNGAAINEANAAVARLNQQTSQATQQGVTVGNAPTNIAQEQAKINTVKAPQTIDPMFAKSPSPKTGVIVSNAPTSAEQQTQRLTELGQRLTYDPNKEPLLPNHAPKTGVSVGNAPTSVEKEKAKIESQLAPKREAEDNYMRDMAEYERLKRQGYWMK